MENENKNLEAGPIANQEETKNDGPKKFNKFVKPVLVFFVIVLVLILIIGGAVIKKTIDENIKLGAENAKLKMKPAPFRNNFSNSDVSSSSNPSDSADNYVASATLNISPDYTNGAIFKGQIDWNKSKKIDDLGLFQSIEKYTNVGRVTQGNYAGYDFDIAWINPEGPNPGFDRVRFLKKDNNYLILGRYSSYQNLETIQASGNPDFDTDENSVLYNNELRVEELETPEFLYGPNPDQKLVKQSSSDSFSTELLKAAFTDPKWGTIWTTDSVKAEKVKNNDGSANAGRSDFDLNGFYIALPDGTSDSYELSIDKIKTLNITWNNGDKMKSEDSDNYSEVRRYGCGLQNFADVFTGNMDELAITGKNSNGLDVYEYKNTNAEAMKNIYDEAYWGENNSQKISYEKFVKDHPIIFVSDSFGRLIQFTTTKYPPMAECGKPVIYLYPQQKTKVNVYVQPTGGLTVSVPDYKKGWQVMAEPDGRLNNLADGKNYPYLFWEGNGSAAVQSSESGFVVGRNDLDGFLTGKLAQTGLIDKEINDFKEFWLPRMLTENKPYYFVTFMGNKYMDKIAPLSIYPKPDTVIRVLMDYRGLESKIDVQPEVIKTATRKGFTVVEWGGVLKNN